MKSLSFTRTVYKQVDLPVPILIVGDDRKAESDSRISLLENAGGGRGGDGQRLCGHRLPPALTAELVVTAVCFCLIFFSLLQPIKLEGINF